MDLDISNNINIDQSKDKEKDKIDSIYFNIIEPEKEIPLSSFQVDNLQEIKSVNNIKNIPTIQESSNVKTKIISNIKNQETTEIKESTLTINTDNFLYLWHTTTMLTSKELDFLSDRVKSDKLPDMFFGYNRFFIVFPLKFNMIFEVNPIQMVNQTNYNIIDSILVKEDNPNNELVNVCYYKPVEAKTQFYDTWKKIKIPEKTDMEQRISYSDWAYSSPYMGTFSNLANHEFYTENLKGNYKIFDSYFKDNIINKNNNFKREATKETIPFQKLGPENTVLKYWETHLYDDELNDNGLSQGTFRLRVMKDCWFGLLRSYLRIDNVLVRIVDTRIFYEFGKNYIIRNFSVKENSYIEIKSKGFNTNSDWALSNQQADLISSCLDVIINLNDKIIIE